MARCCSEPRRRAGLLAALCTLATACGGDDGPARDPGPRAGTGAVATPEEAPVTFGNSGFDPLADLPEMDPALLEAPCADVDARPTRSVPTVTFLVDGSSSMQCGYPESADCDCESQLRGLCESDAPETRWQALSQALMATRQSDGFDGVLAGLDAVIRFGLVLYNDPPDAPSCPSLPVKVDPALDNALAIRDAFPATPPGYNTPTGLALAEVVAGLPDDGEPRHLVLATDGQPFECFDSVTLAPPALDYASVLSATDEAASRGIFVHVLSLSPASGDFAEHLDAVAARGGTGQALLPRDGAELSSQLEAIITDAIDCEITLDGAVEPGLECEGDVQLSGEPLACDDPDGFSLLDPSRLLLSGAACERFKRDPDAHLSVSFPCDVFTPP